MYDYIILGGGIIGLSTAYELINDNPSLSICIIEKEDDICKHQSYHNSVRKSKADSDSSMSQNRRKLSNQECLLEFSQFFECILAIILM